MTNQGANISISGTYKIEQLLAEVAALETVIVDALKKREALTRAVLDQIGEITGHSLDALGLNIDVSKTFEAIAFAKTTDTQAMEA